MTKPPRIGGQELIAALGRAGFEVIRVKGSHRFLRHPDGRCTVVPVYRGEVIGAGLLSKQLYGGGHPTSRQSAVSNPLIIYTVGHPTHP